jgi:hypothetical protein
MAGWSQVSLYQIKKKQLSLSFIKINKDGFAGNDATFLLLLLNLYE